MKNTARFQHAFEAANDNNNHEAAIELYNLEIINDPNNYVAWNNRGISRVQLGIEQENRDLILDGISDFRKALEIADKNSIKGHDNAEANLEWANKILTDFD
ncbi:hypothetical protein SAMN05421788_104262 [Filimonas lacunae]|uniref:Tetratricopeptide repeat-containing protein n=1 Tax=Filimonas lacunae TaxID=477680 RepID=A0A1N7Q1B1_9BACT|nr:hypothetical protein [Filimonas lacunae]SIT16605.1 hypothetical protein SAMN05421788_104262 [Filimonas lacunae]